MTTAIKELQCHSCSTEVLLATYSSQLAYNPYIHLLGHHKKQNKQTGLCMKTVNSHQQQRAVSHSVNEQLTTWCVTVDTESIQTREQ